MSDFHDTPKKPKARKEHRCIYCGGPILVGEIYTHQTGFFEGAPYRNRYHEECFEDCTDELRSSGDDEFSPYNADYPERVRLIVEARRDAADRASTSAMLRVVGEKR